VKCTDDGYKVKTIAHTTISVNVSVFLVNCNFLCHMFLFVNGL